MKTQKLLGIIVVMQGLILAGQWLGPAAADVARADIPNPAERQLALLDEARQTNAKLDKLLALLQSGDVEVKIVKPEAKAEPGNK